MALAEAAERARIVRMRRRKRTHPVKLRHKLGTATALVLLFVPSAHALEPSDKYVAHERGGPTRPARGVARRSPCSGLGFLRSLALEIAAELPHSDAELGVLVCVTPGLLAAGWAGTFVVVTPRQDSRERAHFDAESLSLALWVWASNARRHAIPPTSTPRPQANPSLTPIPVATHVGMAQNVTSFCGCRINPERVVLGVTLAERIENRSSINGISALFDPPLRPLTIPIPLNIQRWHNSNSQRCGFQLLRKSGPYRSLSD